MLSSCFRSAAALPGTPGSNYLGKSLYLRGVGSTPGAIADPMLLASHIVDALDQLATIA